jgi:hypothetical protein
MASVASLAPGRTGIRGVGPNVQYNTTRVPRQSPLTRHFYHKALRLINFLRQAMGPCLSCQPHPITPGSPPAMTLQNETLFNLLVEFG